MRKLVTVEQIESIHDIPGADRIVRARVRGWDIVVKAEEFIPGDVCVFFEIDSFLPATDERYGFLANRGTKTLPSGQNGYVLKTAKLRGVVSQGLVLPITTFPEIVDYNIGDDVTELLCISKWEPPIPASLAGVRRGPWPKWLTKTDEERIQNAQTLYECAVKDAEKGTPWEVYEKLDGSSMSAFFDEGEFGVGSRNINLIEDSENTMWKIARRLDLETKMSHSKLTAVQGELYGESIQSNRLGVKGQHLAIFDVWKDHKRIPRKYWPEWAIELSVPRRKDLENIFYKNSTVEEIINDISGIKSIINRERLAEGVVVRHPSLATVILPDGVGEKASFKVISNKYLLKHGE